MTESLSQRLRAIREAAQQPKSRPSPAPATAPAPAPAPVAPPASGSTPTLPRQPSASPANIGGSATTSSSLGQDDEVERLIRLTRDEVQLERQSELSNGGEDSEEEADPGQVPGRESFGAEPSLPPAPSQRDTSSLLRESEGVLSQAALLQSSATSSSSSPKATAITPPASTSKPRSKPILIRGSSSRRRSPESGTGQRSHETDAEDESAELADDLAEALGEDVSRRRSPVRETGQQQVASSLLPDASQIQAEDTPRTSRQLEPEAEPDEIQDEVDALIARFSALRPAREATIARQASTSPPDARSSTSSPPPAYTSDDSEGAGDSAIRDPFAALSLPSVPSSEPSLPSEPSASSGPAIHPTLGPAHNDLPGGLDLAPFRRLVGRELDVRRLDEPSERSRDPFPSVPGSRAPKSPKEEEEEETFCSICSAPPTLSCFSPRDPEDEGCMGDVYCSECWVQAHEGMEREELREHRTRDLPRKTVGGPRKRGGTGGGRKPVAA